MKNTLMIIVLLFISNALMAQKKPKYETVSIQTSAECGQCKERLENSLNYTKGVKYSELDLETMKLTVKFSPSVISKEAIKELISSLGYDADDIKANPEEQAKLPACCKPGGMKH